MIELTKLNGAIFWLNPHQIEYMEKLPDTTFTMLSGKHIQVREDVPVVIERIVKYRSLVGAFKNEE